MGTASNRWPDRLQAWRAGWLALALLPAVALPAHAQAVDSLQLEVRPGDTLIGIAERYLDTSRRWPALQRRWKGCSSTPNPSSVNMATRC